MTEAMHESIYDRETEAQAIVLGGQHRGFVGGLWDEIGALQKAFLINRGLKPGHKLLDVGCGCLRGGVQFVDYLDTGNYFGVDRNEALLDVGYNVELEACGLQPKLPRENLIAEADFNLHRFNVIFDYALAVSVFTHISFNRIRVCLERLTSVMAVGSRFYATYFPAPEDAPISEPIQHVRGGVTTYADRDPFHYRSDDFVHAVKALPWRVENIGDWGHPRDQHILCFIRAAG